MQDGLEKLVRQFDAAMRQIAPRSMILDHYPAGCCGNASEMLGWHLWDKHQILTNYCNGERRQPRTGTHAWLERGGLIIDLTCCQFADCLHPCPYMGADDAWHSQWDARSRLITDIDLESALESWGSDYHVLLQAIEMQCCDPM